LKKSIFTGILMGLFALLALNLYTWWAEPSGELEANRKINGGASPNSVIEKNQKAQIISPNAPGNATITNAEQGNSLPAGSLQTRQETGNAPLQGKANLDSASTNAASIGIPNIAPRLPQEQQAFTRANGTPAAAAIPIGKPGSASITEIQQKLQALIANGRQPSALEVDAVLAELQKSQGNNPVAGVDLQSMRDTLGRTDRIQQIANEMQAMAANPSKMDINKIQALTAEMQRLQTSLQAGIARPPTR
jgi:hypothetical protein